MTEGSEGNEISLGESEIASERRLCLKWALRLHRVSAGLAEGEQYNTGVKQETWHQFRDQEFSVFAKWGTQRGLPGNQMRKYTPASFHP